LGTKALQGKIHSFGGVAAPAVSVPPPGPGNNVFFGDPYSLKDFGKGLLIGAVSGGIIGGVTAGYNGNNIWTGKPVASGRNIWSFNNTSSGNSTVIVGSPEYAGWTNTKGEFVEEFAGHRIGEVESSVVNEAAANGVVQAEKVSGSYLLEFQSGKFYAGKGLQPRMMQSINRIETTYGDRLLNSQFFPASSTRGAFINEHNLMMQFGGPKSFNPLSPTYNKIFSPGRKLGGF